MSRRTQVSGHCAFGNVGFRLQTESFPVVVFVADLLVRVVLRTVRSQQEARSAPGYTEPVAVRWGGSMKAERRKENIEMTYSPSPETSSEPVAVRKNAQVLTRAPKRSSRQIQLRREVVRAVRPRNNRAGRHTSDFSSQLW